MPRLIFPAIILLHSLVAMGCSPQTPSFPSHIDLLQQFSVHTTQIDGHQLAYLDIGQGPPIILLHGFGGSMWHWEHQLPALAKDHRVLTLDMIGTGLSDKPSIAYTPNFLIHVLKQFMDNLGISQTTLVGNSLGAGVAMGMAMSYPDRVDQLVLISGFPARVVENIFSPSYRRFVEYRPPLWMAKVGSWVAGRWGTERILKEIIFDHGLITPMIIERSYRNRADSGFLFPLYSLVDHLNEWEKSLAPHISEITQPTLILWGAQDRVFPPIVGHRLKESLPHSTIQEIPKAGHLPQWEKPEFVNPAIRQFLASAKYRGM